MTVQPVRLQLSRRKDFRLQELSRATNGLEAVNVARPSKWGNPWKIGGYNPVTSRGYTRDEVIEAFRLALGEGRLSFDNRDVRLDLCGRNLACSCGISDPCHADVLLEIANGSTA